MRELARIDRITNKLNEVWKRFPDMRYIQFIQFVLSFLPEEKKTMDMFFLEDTELEKAIDRMMKGE